MCKEIQQPMTELIQPHIVTMLSADFKTLHIRIIITIMEKLQKTLYQRIDKVPFYQLSLFDSGRFDTVKIVIPLKDFGVRVDEYATLKAALKQLSSVAVELDTVDPVSKEPAWAVKGLLNAYIPNKKYNRNCTIEMDADICKVLTNVDRGFTRFFKEIAYSTQSKYTLRLYLLISSWKDKGGFEININKFRRWLGIGNKYKDFKDLNRRVINPAKEELKEKADCFFEVNELYKEGEKKPSKLKFKVIKKHLSLHEQNHLELQKKSIENMLKMHFGMEQELIDDVLENATIDNVKMINQKCIELHGLFSEEKNIRRIKNMSQYAYKSIKKLMD